MFDKPIVTVSGKKLLFNSQLHQKLLNDLPQEGIEWRRRLDNNTRCVYIDVEFVDFDVDNVERSSERLSKLSLDGGQTDDDAINMTPTVSDKHAHANRANDTAITSDAGENAIESVQVNIFEEPEVVATDDDECGKQDTSAIDNNASKPDKQVTTDAFFNKKLLGRPILHTYWADKGDFDADNQKSQFEQWIGQVQASSCTEWAIVIIEDGDLKTQIGTALFKSKLQSSASQTSASSNSISGMSQSIASSSSILDRMKKGLSTIFQNDASSDRWLTLIKQNLDSGGGGGGGGVASKSDLKARESYVQFVKKFRNLIMASFAKQVELFEEQLRVRRELRNEEGWNFIEHFTMQEELAFAFEFLTLFDEALVQYELLDALFVEYISSDSFKDDPCYEQWMQCTSWPGLCLDMNSEHMRRLHKRVVEDKLSSSLLDMRNYLFAKQCDLMLMQNQPWRVAASATIFLQMCAREHALLRIETVPGALAAWTFVSALEVLQKCECYNCTSTMENYSLHTVDIWNLARRKLIELGHLTHMMTPHTQQQQNELVAARLLDGLGVDPHQNVVYQNDDVSPQTRLRDALASAQRFKKHYIEISELTLGTFKHIGRKRHALLVGKELADFYVLHRQYTKAAPFFVDIERSLCQEMWQPLLDDVRRRVAQCQQATSGQEALAAE